MLGQQANEHRGILSGDYSTGNDMIRLLGGRGHDRKRWMSPTLMKIASSLGNHNSEVSR